MRMVYNTRFVHCNFASDTKWNTTIVSRVRYTHNADGQFSSFLFHVVRWWVSWASLDGCALPAAAAALFMFCVCRLYLSQPMFSNPSVRNVTEQGLARVQAPSTSVSTINIRSCSLSCVLSAVLLSVVDHCGQMAAAGDLEEATVNCVDAWVAKLLDGKTLAESEVVQLCNKVSVSYVVLNFLGTYCCCQRLWNSLYSYLDMT